MNFDGIIIGIICFATIGIFHPIVIKAEYYFSKKIWPLFLIVGCIFLVISVIVESVFYSCIHAIIAASCLWSIHELFEQEKRVKKGWFPKKQ